MYKSGPKISVITACFNSQKTLAQTIESVLNQTYINIELVLVDGASKDASVEIIKQYDRLFKAKGIGYKWISEPDNGIYEALNKGIRIADGEFVAVLGSDDWYEIDALEKVVNEYSKLPSADLIYGAVKFYRNEVPAYIEQIYAVELKSRTMHHQGIVYRKNLHDKYGYYSTTNKISSDYEFLLKCYLKGAKFVPIWAILANFRVGGTNNKYYYIGVKEEAYIKYLNKIINKKELYCHLLKSLVLKYIRK